MKTNLCLSLALAAGLSVRAQVVSPTTSDTAPPTSEPPGFTNMAAIGLASSVLAETGPSRQVWQTVTIRTNQTGKLTFKTNSIVELATGARYQTNGQWLPSKETIQLTETGAAAVEGHSKVFFNADINTSTGSIHLVTGDNRHLRSRLLGISYFDYHSGQSVLIAELTNSLGMVIDNQVLYTNVTTDFRTDLRYTYTRAGLEADAIFRERPPLPEAYGLDPATTRVEVWTEFFDPPEAKIERSIRRGWTKDTVVRSISFGEMKIGQGYSFSLTGGSNERKGVPVEKQWIVTEDRRSFLVEEVPFRWLIAGLRKLSAPRQASIKPIPGSVRHVVSNQRLIPKIKVAQKASPSKMTLAALVPQEPGCVVDWQAVTTTDDLTFQSDRVYKIGSNSVVYLGGTTTIEGGAVIKYETNSTLEIDGPLICLTGPYRPAFLTAANDNSIGETVASGTPSGPSADTALVLTYGADLRYLNIRYANNAIQSSVNYTVNHCQITHCNYGLVTEFANFAAGNILMWDVGTNFYGSWYHGSGVNLTMDAASSLTDDHDFTMVPLDCTSVPSSTVSLTNSLIYNVASEGIVPISKDHTSTPSANPFQTAAGGQFYLADDSPYRGSGNSSIDPALLSDLRTLTTYPPMVIADQTLTANPLALSPQVPPDIGPSVDQGYHYSRLDVTFAHSYAANSTTLTINPGVAIATYGTNGAAFGLDLGYGFQLTSGGTAEHPVWIAQSDFVQEAIPAGYTRSSSGQVVDFSSPSPSSAATFNFTFCSSSADSTVVGLSGPSVYFRDCQILGGNIGTICGHSYSFTNCLFERASVWIQPCDGPPTFLLNNLFYGGFLSFSPDLGNEATVQNNLFVQTSIPAVAPGLFTINHNSYLSGSDILSPGGGDDVIISAADFQPGPLGRYYYPTDGGNLSSLIDAGNTTADAAGLYHYTTQTDQTKEGTSQVDIGWHFVALDGSGNPVDTDGDLVFDYLEDANGNGNGIDDPTSWLIYNSPHGLANGTGLQVYTPLK